jgi:hypothetical protein
MDSDEDIADESLFLVPDNHPLIVLSSDDDNSPEKKAAAIKVKTEKTEMRVKLEPTKRKKTTDPDTKCKKIKLEKSVPSTSNTVAKIENCDDKRNVKKEVERKSKCNVKREIETKPAVAASTSTWNENISVK